MRKRKNKILRSKFEVHFNLSDDMKEDLVKLKGNEDRIIEHLRNKHIDNESKVTIEYNDCSRED